MTKDLDGIHVKILRDVARAGVTCKVETTGLGGLNVRVSIGGARVYDMTQETAAALAIAILDHFRATRLL